ncbi:MAG: DUF1794 domain-containing protein [Actinobacteria bacterium]|uniref:Unannotated protein n=1 Tax=freshwater metagenome TaxID=449393 RepID=A0A6J5YL75_9ZZZZ|nr:DUF1794 domain-containing protein [Actinomycetota bacterium]
MFDYHLDVAHLSWLIGTWVGFGTVDYPTMESGLRFVQELSISHDGQPYLTHWSRTWELDEDGNKVKPLAVEAGFWRPQPDNSVEFLLSHPTGIVEIWSGKVEILGLENAQITGARATLETDIVGRTLSAKEVTSGKRLYGLVDGRLFWAYDMAAVGQDLQVHVAAELFSQVS